MRSRFGPAVAPDLLNPRNRGRRQRYLCPRDPPRPRDRLRAASPPSSNRHSSTDHPPSRPRTARRISLASLMQPGCAGFDSALGRGVIGRQRLRGGAGGLGARAPRATRPIFRSTTCALAHRNTAGTDGADRHGADQTLGGRWGWGGGAHLTRTCLRQTCAGRARNLPPPPIRRRLERAPADLRPAGARAAPSPPR